MSRNWNEQIDHITAAFKNTFGNLTEEALNWKPGNESWSIGQNIAHLIKVNESYYPIIKSIKSGSYQKPFIANIGFMVNFMGKMILKSVAPDRKRKVKTFNIWEPSKSNVPSDIVENFVTHQNELKEFINNSKDLLEKDIIISSPANKNIVYKLKTAFDIIVTHEKRHFEQAKEVLMMLEKK